MGFRWSRVQISPSRPFISPLISQKIQESSFSAGSAVPGGLPALVRRDAQCGCKASRRTSATLRFRLPLLATCCEAYFGLHEGRDLLSALAASHSTLSRRLRANPRTAPRDRPQSGYNLPAMKNIQQLSRSLAEHFNSEASARSLLTDTGLPIGELPSWTEMTKPLDFWKAVLRCFTAIRARARRRFSAISRPPWQSAGRAARRHGFPSSSRCPEMVPGTGFQRSGARHPGP